VFQLGNLNRSGERHQRLRRREVGKPSVVRGVGTWALCEPST
jgi:hypothetical protein